MSEISIDTLKTMLANLDDAKKVPEPAGCDGNSARARPCGGI